jgi:hypothetical protein
MIRGYLERIFTLSVWLWAIWLAVLFLADVLFF